MLSTQLKKAAFIDRDGVLNDLVDRGDRFYLGGKPFRYTAPFRHEELRVKPVVLEALTIIGEKGYLRILVTNQPDVATGHIQPDEFALMMDVFRALPLDGIYVCTHRPGAGCPCRKPRPGMLLEARDNHGIEMGHSYMIGDMETDMEAGEAAFVRTILVTGVPNAPTIAHHRVADILEAAHLLP